MCNCGSTVQTESPSYTPRYIDTSNCQSLQFYVNLKNSLNPTHKHYAQLSSFILSQINVYNKDCNMFYDQITLLLNDNT